MADLFLGDRYDICNEVRILIRRHFTRFRPLDDIIDYMSKLMVSDVSCTFEKLSKYGKTVKMISRQAFFISHTLNTISYFLKAKKLPHIYWSLPSLPLIILALYFIAAHIYVAKFKISRNAFKIFYFWFMISFYFCSISNAWPKLPLGILMPPTNQSSSLSTLTLKYYDSTSRFRSYADAFDISLIFRLISRRFLDASCFNKICLAIKCQVPKSFHSQKYKIPHFYF